MNQRRDTQAEDKAEQIAVEAVMTSDVAEVTDTEAPPAEGNDERGPEPPSSDPEGSIIGPDGA